MGSLTDYEEQRVMNWMNGQVAFASQTWSFALFTSAPSDASGGTEVSGSNYSRVNFSGSFSSATALTANTTTITFPTCTGAAGAWGTVSCMAVFDATTAGNMLMWATLTAAKTIATNDVAQFATGSVTIAID